MLSCRHCDAERDGESTIPMSKPVVSDSGPGTSAVDLSTVPGAVRSDPCQGLGGRAGAETPSRKGGGGGDKLGALASKSDILPLPPIRTL